MYDVPDLRTVSQSARMVTLYGVHWQESPKAHRKGELTLSKIKEACK